VAKKIKGPDLTAHVTRRVAPRPAAATVAIDRADANVAPWTYKMGRTAWSTRLSGTRRGGTDIQKMLLARIKFASIRTHHGIRFLCSQHRKTP
jgi:hypothetical protein